VENQSRLIKGEHRRLFDDRHRVALPTDFAEALGGDNADCVISKEREGCLSLWPKARWEKEFGRGVELLETRLRLELERDVGRLQQLVRLISARSRPLKIGHRGRLLIPEGFREFLGASANVEVILVGAGVCVELWRVEAWSQYLRAELQNFDSLFQQLVGRTDS
jgi:MraZ protein